MSERRSVKIVMVGPNNAGKTAILERMVTGEFVETTPKLAST